jgi:glycerol-3-phosphate dehydrogenase subunit B
MKTGVLVVGAGLAGLVAALRLAEDGRPVTAVATGMGAIQLAPGTLDVLGYAPELVERPLEALPGFADSHPDHPYAVLGATAVRASVEWLLDHDGDLGQPLSGDAGENLLLPTAAGAARPSGAAPETLAGGDLRRGPRVVAVGFRQLRDFHAAYMAANLAALTLPGGGRIQARAIELVPPADGEADLGTLRLARLFEDAGFRQAVADELRPQLEGGETVAMPAVLGVDDARVVWQDLQDRLGAPVFEVPTVPPSIPGLRRVRALRTALARAGGRLIVGPRAVGIDRANGIARAVHFDVPPRPVTYEADSIVLATGGFAAGGLARDSHGTVRETVAGLDPAFLPGNGEDAFGATYFDDHPLARTGIAVDERMHPVGRDGAPIYENLYAAGALVGGAVPWREGSGDGISLATGFAAAGAILEETH